VSEMNRALTHAAPLTHTGHTQKTRFEQRRRNAHPMPRFSLRIRIRITKFSSLECYPRYIFQSTRATQSGRFDKRSSYKILKISFISNFLQFNVCVCVCVV